jgi:hypothetical protein
MMVNQELVARLITAERDCYVDWVQAMDEDYAVAVQSFGKATAIVCGKVSAEIWNRVFNLTPEDFDKVPEILEFYQQHKAQALFDLTPYTVPAYWDKPNMTYWLAKKYGMFQATYHQMLYGTPTTDVPATPSHIEIQEVDPNDLKEFEATYQQVWGNGRDISVLAGKPNFRCYVAYIDDQPAALGVVHIANGAASMANGLTIPSMRGKGCQTALLYHRIKQAATEGCDLLVSQCAPGSQSQYNQLKVGFQIAGTKTWWIRVDDVS